MAAISVPLIVSGTTADAAPTGPQREFNVLTEGGASVAVAERAVREAGGTVIERNAAVGLLTAKAPQNGFRERVTASPAVAEAAPVRSIGSVPKSAKPGKPISPVDRELSTGAGAKSVSKANPQRGKAKTTDPLDDNLWGLKSVRSDLARTKQPGDKRVLVGVLDTGIDGSHPDLKANFNKKLSRNFVRDIPFDENGVEVDGPCEFRGCVDPVDHDDDGHGSHVAGTIAAAANGLGVSGVAPKVSLVNIRAGQDSGYFFLQSTVDALTYAGDAGIDVINMSFYVDPWLYNCRNNPADSAEERAQQRLAISSITRALNYAHRHNVTMVSALGNEHTDIGKPLPDVTSPNFPAGNEHSRTIDNATCLTMPTEGPNVLAVGSFGPSGAKADYSNYGTERISVGAPGGYARDYFGTPWFNTVQNEILSTYPRNVALAAGDIDADGNITEQGKSFGVQKSCKPNNVCGYYQWLQGTSMASPHATGVAALIVSQYAKYTKTGATMKPDAVRTVLEGTAYASPCPTPRTVSYANEGRPAEFDATCEGNTKFNGFYGHGRVDAYAAVTKGAKLLR